MHQNSANDNTRYILSGEVSEGEEVVFLPTIICCTKKAQII